MGTSNCITTGHDVGADMYPHPGCAACPQGLEPAVSEAIFEAALPRQAGDTLPRSHAGQARRLRACATAAETNSLFTVQGCAPSRSTAGTAS